MVALHCIFDPSSVEVRAGVVDGEVGVDDGERKNVDADYNPVSSPQLLQIQLHAQRPPASQARHMPIPTTSQACPEPSSLNCSPIEGNDEKT